MAIHNINMSEEMQSFTIQTSDESLRCAINAVRNVTSMFREGYGLAESEMKKDGSPVTKYDTEIEKQLVHSLTESYPNSQIIGEEATNSGVEDGDLVWIIDPIDGTINYELGSLSSAIAVGIEKDDEIYGGVISLPLEDKIYYGTVDGNAYENGNEMSVLDTEELERFVVGAEFRPENLAIDGHMDMVNTVAEKCQTIRCVRSGVSDGAFVASGRQHVAYNMDTNIWDVAASTALVRAAGGTVTTPSGSEDWDKIKTGNALYSTGVNHDFFTQFF